MKTAKEATALPTLHQLHELNQIEKQAQRIARQAHELNLDYMGGYITAIELARRLETLHRSDALELVAMIANLQSEVRS